MATVNDIVVAALKEIGVLAAGETATAEDASDALASLNRLLDQWAAERLQIYTVTRTTWTIAANDGQYSVGASADVNVARPVFIDHVHFVDTSTDPDTESALQPLTEDAWARIEQKALTATLPQAWYYNPTFPTGTLSLWPVPTSATLLGALYAPQAVVAFSVLTSSVSLPPGYERMLVKHLALELLPSYEKQPNPVLLEAARESRAVVKAANKRLMDLSFELAALGSVRSAYDIRLG